MALLSDAAPVPLLLRMRLSLYLNQPFGDGNHLKINISWVRTIAIRISVQTNIKELWLRDRIYNRHRDHSGWVLLHQRSPVLHWVEKQHKDEKRIAPFYGRRTGKTGSGEQKNGHLVSCLRSDCHGDQLF